MKCQHEGCHRETVIDCVPEDLYRVVKSGRLSLEYLKDADRAQVLDEYLEYYCVHHAVDHGYCIGCGHYRYQLNDEGICFLCQMTAVDQTAGESPAGQ